MALLLLTILFGRSRWSSSSSSSSTSTSSTGSHSEEELPPATATPPPPMDHEAELQAFIDAAARQGNEVSIESAERIYLGLVMMRGVDASMGMKLMTYAMPHAMPTGKGLFGDARALAQALYDIREAEGEAVRVQCDETLKVLLTTWRAEDERAAAAAAA